MEQTNLRRLARYISPRVWVYNVTEEDILAESSLEIHYSGSSVSDDFEALVKEDDNSSIWD